MKKTKILHIAKPVGGVGVYIHILAKYINIKRFENIIIYNEKDNVIAINDSEEIPIKKYHVNLEREISITNDFKCLKEIVKLIKEIKPDVIHCHSAKAGVLGRIAGNYLKIPTLYTPHAYSYLSTNNKIKKLVFKLIERYFKSTKSITLACSNSEYERAINDLKYSKDKVLVWNNSVEKIDRNSLDNSIDITIPENFICTIGRPSYQKNTELLIRAVYKAKEEIKDIHLVILGVGLYSPLLNEVNMLIKDLKLEKNITLISWLPREKSLAILDSSLFLVSSSRYEGLPYSVIEALSLSKACVLTKVDGNKDLVNNNVNGFLVEENIDDLSNKIIELYKNPVILKEQSKASYDYFLNNFYIEKNIKNLENIYSNVI